MEDVTIIKERGPGGLGTMAKVIANNPEAMQILEALIEQDQRLAPAKCFTIHSEAAEEMAETLAEKGLAVSIK